MAVDSRDKRFSLFAVGASFRLVLPNPDGSLGAGDRLQLAYLYRGIAAVAYSPFVPPPIGAVTYPSAAVAAVTYPTEATATATCTGVPRATTVET